ncbi:WD40/YVTN/BNR-like repeat-containing protein [Dactylosporangium sp. CS-047395]|uniref:WD40/YVTN/BNR-like repeat-containing protein n=1 Tax=Dactylosporangium sp. CS-047395 TaxID=3239936 RepID=UPI003D8F2137
MRPDLDFRTLRQQIEQATWVPDFSTLYRRAGRVKLRDRMTVLGALLGTLGVLAPVALAGIFGRPGPAVLGPNPDLGEAWSPIASATPTATGRYPSTVTVLAAAGDLPNLIAAVDVCAEIPQARRCSLQIVALGGQAERRTPFVVDALRTSPLDRVSNVQLLRVAQTGFILSGEVGGGSRSSVRFALTSATQTELNPQDAAPVMGPNDHLALSAGDRTVQLVQYGDLFGVRESDGALSLISQPPMARRTIAALPPASAGWWVTGADLNTGAPAVSVSTDQGATWTARTLDAPAGSDVPTVATSDGKNAWAFVPYSSGIRLFRTSDGGSHWREVRGAVTLPPELKTLDNRLLGALVRPDRSVLMWVYSNPATVNTTVFFDSNDGEHFAVVSGPGGTIAAVDNGYASLGDPARVSHDAHSWQEAALSSTVMPN